MVLQHAMNLRGAPWISADGCHGAAGGPKLGLRNTVKFNAKLWEHKVNFYKSHSDKTPVEVKRNFVTIRFEDHPSGNTRAGM